MSRFFNFVQKIVIKFTGHEYKTITIKLPFINLSFAPVYVRSSNWSCFFYFKILLANITNGIV